MAHRLPVTVERWDLLCAFIAGLAVAIFLVTAYPGLLGLVQAPAPADESVR